jgi:hypothetical protein
VKSNGEALRLARCRRVLERWENPNPNFAGFYEVRHARISSSLCDRTNQLGEHSEHYEANGR